MRKHNGMRPQDIVILLKIVLWDKKDWQFQDLSRELHISGAEITASLNRSKLAGLIDYNRKRVNKLSLMEFIEHGLSYVFPEAPGALVKGIPTGHSHPSLIKKIMSDQAYVWPDIEGNSYGQAIEPFYANQIKAVKKDQKLHEVLAMLDVLRTGKIRERKIAIDYLKSLLKGNESPN